MREARTASRGASNTQKSVTPMTVKIRGNLWHSLLSLNTCKEEDSKPHVFAVEFIKSSNTRLSLA